MDYVEIDISVDGDERAEILTALLSDLPFESFAVEAGHLRAYIPARDYDACRGEAAALLDGTGAFERSERTIAQQNWNAAWESDFEPVEVAGAVSVCIRAPHHTPPREGVTDVIVVPRMSFGTGHHVTTALMTRAVTAMGVEGLRGLDMGCGTGVLAIVAAKCGAAAMTAVDTDEWACESCRESVALSGTADRTQVVCGSAESVAGRRFDFILANINRNILLGMMPSLAAMLAAGGRCAVSGFLAEDLAAMDGAAGNCGLVRTSVEQRDGWVAAVYRKQDR